MSAMPELEISEFDFRQREQDRLEKFGEELRQPLACAYGYAEMLLTRDFNADMQRDLHAALLVQLDAVRCVMEHYVPTKEVSGP